MSRPRRNWPSFPKPRLIHRLVLKEIVNEMRECFEQNRRPTLDERGAWLARGVPLDAQDELLKALDAETRKGNPFAPLPIVVEGRPR